MNDDDEDDPPITTRDGEAFVLALLVLLPLGIAMWTGIIYLIWRMA